MRILVSILLGILITACGGNEGGENGGSKGNFGHSVQLLSKNILGQVSLGSEHSCALTLSGQVRCWGLGTNGRLGNGDASNRGIPTAVVARENSQEPLENIVQISAGVEHSCALTSKGGVVCWGTGNNGRLGNGSSSSTKYPVTVVEGDGSDEPLADMVQISVGKEHSCALTSSGQVLCWGRGRSGRLGLGISFGNNKDHPVTVMDGEGSDKPLKDIIQISAGQDHTCALSSLGRVLCWGVGQDGRLGNGSDGDKVYPVEVVEGEGSEKPLKNIVQVSTSSRHTCALTTVGSVLCWGYGSHGRLGIDDSSNADKHYPVAVVEAEGSTEPLANVIQISTGGLHSCALLFSGEVRCWGAGIDGRLGYGDTDNKPFPVTVLEASGSEPLNNIVEISVGSTHVCGMTTSGKLLCWGKGNRGQLGDGKYVSKKYPATVVNEDKSGNPLRLGIKILPWGCYADGNCARLSAEKIYQNSGGGILGQLSLGSSFSCALTYGGEVKCWGMGDFGQLGNGSDDGQEAPVAVVKNSVSTDSLKSIIQVSTGGSHTCALTSSGEVKCWGWGGFGQLGVGFSASKNAPINVVKSSSETDTLSDIVQISAGFTHTCAVTTLGRVKCWGDGAFGQLGDGNNNYNSHVVDVLEEADSTDLLGDIVEVSSGTFHTCGLTTLGRVKCWGSGDNGELGNNREETTNTPVFVSDSSGSNTPIEGIIQISVGGSHSCALTLGGQVRCWGLGAYGRLGNGNAANKNYPVTVLAENGTAPLQNIVRISSGFEHTCALTSSAQVLCWGLSANGQSEDSYRPVKVMDSTGNTPLGNIAEIAAGGDHTCAKNFNGIVFCWGGGDNGQLGNDSSTDSYSTPVTVIDGEDSSNVLRLGVRNRPWACYLDGLCQKLSPDEGYENDGGGLLDQISSGGNHVCALTSGGEVRCWGTGGDGQLGNDSTANKDHPVTVLSANGVSTALEDIVQITSGENHTCALGVSGSVKCWGDGTSGQLGNGGTSDLDNPVAVTVDTDNNWLEGIVQISSGADHTCVLTTEGTVLCWGEGEDGRLGNGDANQADQSRPVGVSAVGGGNTLLKGIVQISGGGAHTCALTSGKTILCWGQNTYGQLGLGTNYVLDENNPVPVMDGDGSTTPLANIVQVSAGENHTCALTSGGEVWCWGDGSSGRLGYSSNFSTKYPVRVVNASGSSTPLGNIVQISSGGEHNCALTSGGNVYCWGKGANGRLGNNLSVNRNYAVAVETSSSDSNALANVVRISTGGDHTCVLISSGEVRCWGLGTNGRLGNGDSVNKDHPVSVVAGHRGISTLNLGTKRRPWGCFRDGLCQFLIPSGSY